MSEEIARHWFSDRAGALIERIDEALRRSGRDPEDLQADDLVAVDEFHIRGREATAELASLVGFTPGMSVVDVGSGLGGPSRYLAGRCGCRVTGVDLTAEYCSTATVLADRVGLAGAVEYRQGDALALPFADASFDVAWTQHISMNVADKGRMFAEMARVTRPGGRVVVYDPIRGPVGEPLSFPVPWSRDGAISFLVDSDATRALLASAGLEIETWIDVSRRSLEWFRRNAARAPAEPPVLGLHLLLGSEWPRMAANMVANLAAGRLAVVQVVAKRP
ncbi:MAG: methyltransferase domain-containing protein [Thermoanaerobaculia bacterium]|nr:methyltransferase domain-containing protein [Thermoanaerobaculia bacterium]